MVEYRRIEGFTGYYITNDGRVWSEYRNKWVPMRKDKNGYLRVSLYKRDDKKPYTKNIHRLVGEAFLERTDDNLVIDHIDRNKENNNVSNLRWVTVAENNWNRGKYPENRTSQTNKYNIIKDNKVVTTVTGLREAGKFLNLSTPNTCLHYHKQTPTGNGYMIVKIS